MTYSANLNYRDRVHVLTGLDASGAHILLSHSLARPAIDVELELAIPCTKWRGLTVATVASREHLGEYMRGLNEPVALHYGDMWNKYA